MKSDEEQRPSAHVFHMQPELVGETLVTALRHWLPDLSWSQLKKWITGRQVQINGNLCLDQGRRLTENDVVKVLPFPVAPPPTDDDVRIRFLDTHLVIVEKPAGMTTLRHAEERQWPRRRKQLQPTLDEVLPRLIDVLEHKRRPRKETGKGSGSGRARGLPPRVRPVHRLDRETSGLMVFARTPDAEHLLGLQFRAHELDRRYLAVVWGHVPEQTFESLLADNRGDGKRGSTSNPNLGKLAITHVRPIEHLGDYSLIECRLETGRTHQIRIHLAEAGHPLCGDKVYRGRFAEKPLPDTSGAPRVALHAAELGLLHPITQERLHFEMPLPPDLTHFIDRLRGHSRPRKPSPRPASRSQTPQSSLSQSHPSQSQTSQPSETKAARSPTNSPSPPDRASRQDSASRTSPPAKKRPASKKSPPSKKHPPSQKHPVAGPELPPGKRPAGKSRSSRKRRIEDR